MTDDDKIDDAAFNTFTARMIHREAQRRAAQELSTTTPHGLEHALAQIADEVTAEAMEAKQRQVPREPAKKPAGE